MMRIYFAFVAMTTVCAGVSLVSAAGQDDAKKDLAALKGTWGITSAEKDGKDVTDKAVTLTFDGSKVIVKKDAKILFEGSYKIDPAKKPKTIDVVQESEGDAKGKTIPGIYILDGDSLKICSPSMAGKD